MASTSDSPSGRGMSTKAYNIEMKSFEIIDKEIVTHSYDPQQWEIVRRVVHATADFDFAKADKGKLIFHHDAIESAFSAIRKRSHIVTDVDMVASGINKKLLKDLEIETVCNISRKEIAEEATRKNKTRAEISMRKAINEIDEGIVVIGNAPTALYEIISMIRERVVRPKLVIGIPVGFVSSPESKEELTKVLEIPYITNLGRKGGSSVASSIVNAILLLYSKRISNN